MKPRTKPLPEISRLREALSYDPLSGHVTWKSNRYAYRGSLAAAAGSIAGSAMSLGYRFIHFEDVGLLIHRVAWAMYYGEWPRGDIDHINMDKSDNRILNLRLATRAQNMVNRGPTKGNLLGVKGVGISRQGKYTAKIWAGGKRIHIGTFETIAEASAAYENSAKEIHGEFYCPPISVNVVR